MNWPGISLGILISLGSIGSYIPQFYKIIKYDSIEGISEMSLVLMNIALMCLTMNSLIYSWSYFFCQDIACLTNLFPFVQISISWLMVLVYYFIFITYKFKKNKHKEKRILSGMHYLVSYLLFTIFVVALSLGEKIKGNSSFFITFANILGYTSAVLNSLVYLPQIFKLYQIKSVGNLSFLMYFLQTPGNLIIIIFQAVIYNASVSTWITYVVVLVEQSVILSLMTFYHCCPHKSNNLLQEHYSTEI